MLRACVDSLLPNKIALAFRSSIQFKMKRLIFLPFALCLWVLPACSHSLSMHSMDGEKLSGRWRFARADTGLIQVTGSAGEVLNGKFVRVGRPTFIQSYEKTFGSGSIAVDGPDLSSYGNAFGGIFVGSYSLTDAAYGESFNSVSGNSGTAVSGPLFYWIASLRSDRETTMGCYFIGSSYTGHGFGRCKSHSGKEYSVEF